jgi:hypothetical protein
VMGDVQVGHDQLAPGLVHLEAEVEIETVA